MKNCLHVSYAAIVMEEISFSEYVLKKKWAVSVMSVP